MLAIFVVTCTINKNSGCKIVIKITKNLGSKNKKLCQSATISKKNEIKNVSMELQNGHWLDTAGLRAVIKALLAIAP